MGGSAGGAATTGNNGFQDFIQGIGTAVGGSPSTNAVLQNMDYLKAPQQSNYQIAGMDNYQNQLQSENAQSQYLYNQQQNSPLVTQGQDQQMQAYNSLQNMANGQGPSLARANLQAGLNQTNQALQSQAMSSASSGAGGGNSQRNLLNAQAAAANNVQQQGQQASVAEQMGALQQQGAAANSIRNSAMAQQGINAQNNQNLLNNELNTANAGFGANLAQTQANMGYDQANQNYGMAQANVGLQGANSGAKATRDAFGFFGNLLQGSDQNIKTDIEEDDSGAGGGDSNIMSFLRSFKDSQDSTKDNAASMEKMTGMPAIGAHSASLSNSGIQPMGGFVDQDDTRNGLNNFVPKNELLGDKPASGGLGNMGNGPGSEGGGPMGAVSNILGDGEGGEESGEEEEDGGSDSKGLLGGLLGGSGGGGGGELLGGILSMFSDERTKKDVKGSDEANNEFMGKLKSKSYRYKNPNTPFTTPGRVHGVMAQDMEKSQVGRDMVINTPMGKMFNLPKAVSASLSSLATLNKRMDHLEKKAG